MPYKIAFQLYSSRNFPPIERQLEGLAAIGYDAVEPWLPAYEASAREFRRKIDDAGLACYGFHLPYKGLVADPQRFIDIAKTIGAIVLIVDPDLIVLGGGIGRAPGFAAMIETRLRTLTPITPPIKVTALGIDAVVDGCLVSGLARVWSTVADGRDRNGVER